MYAISVTPPKFNSNIYVYRSNLSKWLTEYVDIRNNVESYVMQPDNIHQIDKWLKKYHYEFLKIKKNIELIERDIEIFGS